MFAGVDKLTQIFVPHGHSVEEKKRADAGRSGEPGSSHGEDFRPAPGEERPRPAPNVGLNGLRNSWPPVGSIPIWVGERGGWGVRTYALEFLQKRPNRDVPLRFLISEQGLRHLAGCIMGRATC